MKRIDGWIQPGRQTVSVLVGLQFDADQRITFGLRLQSADRLAVHEQQVVGKAVAGRHLE